MLHLPAKKDERTSKGDYRPVIIFFPSLKYIIERCLNKYFAWTRRGYRYCEACEFTRSNFNIYISQVLHHLNSPHTFNLHIYYWNAKGSTYMHNFDCNNVDIPHFFHSQRRNSLNCLLYFSIVLWKYIATLLPYILQHIL